MKMIKFVVLYGSETGTAQDVAERIWKEGKVLGLSGPVLAMDEYPVTQLPSESLVLFVCSTTGQGDPPTNMKHFWRFLLRKSLPLDSLHNLKFGVLGLGDSSYTKFNHTGKKLQRRLEMLGGQSLLAPGWADDQHDLGPDAVVDPWIKQLLKRLTEVHPQLSLPDLPPPLISKWGVQVERRSLASRQHEDECRHRLVWPLSATSLTVRLASNIRTTPQHHFQEVRLLRFDSPESAFQYKSGDVAVVRPSNSESSVASLMEALPQMNANDVLTVKQRDEDMPLPPHLVPPITFLQLATHYWDLSAVPRRSVLEVLSRVDIERSEESETEREKLAELCSSDGQEEYFSYCTRPRRTIVELLLDFPHTSKALPVNFLFDIFQPIRPRMFSIASAPQRGYVELLVAVVSYKTRLFKPRLGLCSTWLASLSPGTHLQMHVRTGSLDFNNLGNLIMVGPGTGVAPFRSFICSGEFARVFGSHAATGSAGRKQTDAGDLSFNSPRLSATLVFGCRNSAADFHFKDDFVDTPGLELYTAFSRDQPHKIYVQNVLSEHREKFGRLLIEGERVRIMVAGSSKDMPDAVRLAFVQAVASTGSLSQSDADKFIESMENKGLYQTETWS